MRWMVTDPAGQFWFPYVGLGNNLTSGVDPDGEFFGKLRAKINAFFRGGTYIPGDNGNHYVQYADGTSRNFGQSGFKGKAEITSNRSIRVGELRMLGAMYDEYSFEDGFGGAESNKKGAYVGSNIISITGMASATLGETICSDHLGTWVGKDF